MGASGEVTFVDLAGCPPSKSTRISLHIPFDQPLQSALRISELINKVGFGPGISEFIS